VAFAGGDVAAFDAADKKLFAASVLNGGALSTWREIDRSPRKVNLVSSVLASGEWYRITVTDEGIYKVDAQYLQSAGINVSGIDPRTIKIYGNGGRELPEDVAKSRPNDLVENAIYIEGESDGSFGSGDYILFYGRSPRMWVYDTLARTMRHTLNHYSESNY
jgi:hypothetical protein